LGPSLYREGPTGYSKDNTTDQGDHVKHSEFALMVSKVNSAFAVMARSMMDYEGSESTSVEVLIEVDRACAALANSMDMLARYSKTFHEDEAAQVIKIENFLTGDND
jgi:hypothetical protein